MCLAYIVRDLIPEIPLLLLFNRDEDFERVSLPVHFWSEAPHVLGGFDNSSRGTWAGVSRQGRFGMLTFVREPRLSITPSGRRGQIVRDFLLGDKSAEDYVAELEAEPDAYLGYNVILGDPESVVHYNNRSRRKNVIGKGVFGVSNADFETPWFKVLRGKAAIERLLASGVLSPEAFFEILEDKTIAPDEQVQKTGLSFERERSKSPLFVSLPDYGTRSSSVVKMFRSGEIHFRERSYAQGGTKRLEVDIRTGKGW